MASKALKKDAKHVPESETSLDPIEPYLHRLRLGGVKVTPNRRKVIGRFLAVESPWTLKSLHQSLSAEADCDSSSVYRTLEALRSAGLLEEFRLPGEKQTFFALIRTPENEILPESMRNRNSKKHSLIQSHGNELGLGLDPGRNPHEVHHHHHILCQDCGKVSHLHFCLPLAWLGNVEHTSGFKITEHHLEFKGVCAECKLEQVQIQ